MQRRNAQRGEGQFGCLVGLVILLVAGLVAYKMIPIKVKAAELRDVITDESRSASQSTDARILKVILDAAERNGLPVTEENVKIRRSSDRIEIDVEYTVPVEFPGYTYNWGFHHKVDNPLF